LRRAKVRNAIRKFTNTFACGSPAALLRGNQLFQIAQVIEETEVDLRPEKLWSDKDKKPAILLFLNRSMAEPINACIGGVIV
jgi:hypothetical protein